MALTVSNPDLSQQSETRALPPAWPLYVVLVGYPVWWVLGLSGFVWIVAAAAMLIHLIFQGNIKVPRSFGIWMLFLAWMLLSSIQVTRGNSFLTFGYRALIYLSATVWFIYVLNLPREMVPSSTLVYLLTAYWIVIWLGGFAGLAFAHVSFRSPLESLLNHTGFGRNLLSSDYFYKIIHPQFAEVQHFIGYQIARPAAPFTYTNWWGGNFAAVVPFVLAALALLRSRAMRIVLVAMLVLSLIPVIESVNRGLWLSLSAGLIYAVIRFMLKGNVKPLLASLAVGVLFAVAILASPLATTIQDRIHAERNSNEHRLNAYVAAVDAVKHSPLLGYGVPQQPPKHSKTATVGTGGLLWLVLYTTGVPGLALFLAWFILVLWESRSPPSIVGLWAHVSVAIVLIQIFYYDMFPSEFHVLLIAAAVAWREMLLSSEAEAEQPVALPLAIASASSYAT